MGEKRKKKNIAAATAQLGLDIDNSAFSFYSLILLTTCPSQAFLGSLGNCMKFFARKMVVSTIEK